MNSEAHKQSLLAKPRQGMGEAPTYPYKKYFMNMETLYERAKDFKPWILTEDRRWNIPRGGVKLLHDILGRLSANGQPEVFGSNVFIIFTDPTGRYMDYEVNFLTDMFSEECRVKCQLEKSPMSPYDAWATHQKDIIAGAKRNFKVVSPETLNKYMEFVGYSLGPGRNVRICTNYKLTYLLGLMKLFKPRRWLDMSAGWGDRLLAAIIHGTEYYCGIDPNACLHPCYQNAINTLVPAGRRASFHMIQAEAQKLPSNFTDQTFDFIFTSPPFFTFEIYEGGAANLYTSIETWLNKFLYKTIEIAWTKLEVGGHYGLYIEDKPEYRFIDQLKEYMAAKPDCKYVGVVYQVFYDPKYTKNPYSMKKVYFWKKV